MLGFVLVSVVSVLTTAAAVALVRFGRGGVGGSAVAPGLAAGVMLWIALVEVAPASARAMGSRAGFGAMAAGVVLVWLAARVVRRTTVAAGIAPVLGVALVLHDLPEGFAVGAALSAAGLAVSLPLVVAVAAHNLPEKLAFVAPFEGGRVPAAVLAAATLPEPLGAALAAAGSTVAPGVVDAAVAVAGGMMAAVAIGALPEVARRAGAWRPFLGAGAAGAASVAALGLVFPT